MTSLPAVSLVLAGLGNLGGALPAESELWTYLTIFAFVLGDAVFAVFPGETAIIAASVLAVDGELSLAAIIIAAATAAMIGDSIVFWIGSKGHGPLRASHGQSPAERRYTPGSTAMRSLSAAALKAP